LVFLDLVQLSLLLLYRKPNYLSKYFIYTLVSPKHNSTAPFYYGPNRHSIYLGCNASLPSILFPFYRHSNTNLLFIISKINYICYQYSPINVANLSRPLSIFVKSYPSNNYMDHQDNLPPMVIHKHPYSS